MKKILFVIAVAVIFSLETTAQNTFNKGDKVVNLGVGIGSTYYTGGYYTSRIPPVSASLEVGVKDELFDEKSSLGIGGYLGYTGAKWDHDGWGWKYNSIIVGARGAIHYQLIDKMDTYTGLMLGYNIVNSTSFGSDGAWSTSSASASGIAYSWFLGGRYYFSDNFAGMLELGYGIAYLTVGVALKF